MAQQPTDLVRAVDTDPEHDGVLRIVLLFVRIMDGDATDLPGRVGVAVQQAHEGVA
ncbi:hypothetical protein [Streptomyces sp. NBC_00539]|uniref:hypothetical protein n=1 Tax=Streptomyces sp. NBC_00539 TaxID=2975770 RepID=UPI002E815F4A|nr:hypothetical protein [Streptomyces sp. NBC_00539]WUC63022.1 hypothetical protein OG861_01725 [Streptomyces sp. NBC_00539]